MQEYSLGFMFSPTGNYVVLLEKARPDWQKGKLNGVGGHVEQGETPDAAIIREFYEETGVQHEEWIKFAIMDMKGRAIIHCYKSFSEKFLSVDTKTDEQVAIYKLTEVIQGEFTDKMIPNLKYLIQIALDSEISTTEPVLITYGHVN